MIKTMLMMAAVPLSWTVTPERPAPAQFDRYHGETLEFRCAFAGFGTLPFAEGADVRLWYQTNGMGAAWWSIPATVLSNVLEAAWGPSCDPGAERVAFFFGAPSNAYAAAQVRFRNSPGAHPNDLDPPSVLDWQAELAAATNDLFKSFAPTITNTYTRAETDARIAELAPRTSLAPATNYIDHVKGLIEGGLIKAGAAGQADRAYEADTASSARRADSADLAMNAIGADNATWADHAYYLDDGSYQLTASEIMNAIPDANNLATKSELAAVSNEAQVVYRLFSGSNVVDEVTNYNSQVRLPSRRMYQLSESNTYFKVWDEIDQHTNTLGQAKRYTDERMAALPGVYAPKAWSGVTSGMGVEAPANTTWLSTPTTVIAGGYEPEKWITSGGEIWLITSRGAVYDFSPATNNTAYMNISASDGTPMFRIEKTDSYLLGVLVDAVHVDGNALVCDIELAGPAPFARVCTNLQNAVWYKEEDGIPASVATVTTTATAGGYTSRIANTSGGKALFAYFEYLQEGGTKIINEAVMDVSQGILCTDGVHKVRPVYNNGAITWEVVQ